MVRSVIEIRSNGDVWEVVRDGRVLMCELFRHGAVNWAARKLEPELADPAPVSALELVGVDLSELQAVLARRQVCDLCGTADFSGRVVRSVRSVYQCRDCKLVSCPRCIVLREEGRGCSRGHCGRCGSPHIVNIEASPPPP